MIQKIKKMIPNNVKFYINKCLKPAKFIHYLLLKPKFKECCNQYNIKFQTDVETVNQIINEKKSLSRFGDGEMLWTLNIEHRSYQKSSEELTKKLKEVLQNKNKNLIIGLPNLLDKENLNKYNLDCRIHWVKFITSKFKEFIKFVDRDRIYADAQITRCYIDYKDKSFTKERYANLERIWYEKEVLIVEGEKTRLGIGNDLFSNAKKIERIICPSTNAFDKYEEILNAIKKNGKNKIIILALGPTATILAKDICDLNGDKIEYQALDLGHIDIEYEWFLMRAKKRNAVKGKYVNEVWKENLSDVSLNKNDEDMYNESIIYKITN